LTPPKRIKADVEELRRSEDVIGQFLETSAETGDQEVWIRFSDLYLAFKRWFHGNIDERDKYLPSKKKFGIQMEKKGFKKNNTGDRVVYGVRVTDFELLRA
jgi:phage/plasmid-associated DNA primase